MLSPKHAPGKGSKPPPAAKPSHLSPTHHPPVSVAQATPPAAESWQAEDDQVRKKVLELQKRKVELQKQREKSKVCAHAHTCMTVCT